MALITDMGERIMKMGISEAYNFLISTENADSSVLTRARWGFLRPPIDIYDYMNGTLMFKKKRGVILYKGYKFTSEQVYTDMERRVKMMKKYLLKELGILTPLVEPR